MNAYVTGATVKKLRERGFLYYCCNRHGLFKKRV